MKLFFVQVKFKRYCPYNASYEIPSTRRIRYNNSADSSLKLRPYFTLKKLFCCCFVDEDVSNSPSRFGRKRKPAAMSSNHISVKLSQEETSRMTVGGDYENRSQSVPSRRGGGGGGGGGRSHSVDVSEANKVKSVKCVIHNVGIIDRYSRYVFPLAYFILNAIYWHYYKWIS